MKQTIKGIFLILILTVSGFLINRNLHAGICAPATLKRAMEAPLIVEASLEQAKSYTRDKAFINEADFRIKKVLQGKYSLQTLRVRTVYAGLTPTGIPMRLKKSNIYVLFLYHKRGVNFSMSICNPSINFTRFSKNEKQYRIRRAKLHRRILEELKKKYNYEPNARVHKKKCLLF